MRIPGAFQLGNTKAYCALLTNPEVKGKHGINKYPLLRERLAIYTEAALAQLETSDTLLKALNKHLKTSDIIDWAAIQCAPFNPKIIVTKIEGGRYFSICLEGEENEILMAEKAFSEPGKPAEACFKMSNRINFEPGTIIAIRPAELPTVRSSIGRFLETGGSVIVKVDEKLIQVRDKFTGRRTRIVRAFINTARMLLKLDSKQD